MPRKPITFSDAIDLLFNKREDITNDYEITDLSLTDFELDKFDDDNIYSVFSSRSAYRHS